MEVKERCKLSSSPHYAYGPLGIPGICGPGKLITIKDSISLNLILNSVFSFEVRAAYF